MRIVNKRRPISLTVATVWAGMALCASSAFAQEDQAPKPATRVYFPGLASDQDEYQRNADALQPDTTPLTGIQTPTLGVQAVRHSYWVPGFQYGNTIQNIALNQATASGWYSNSYVVGNLSVLEARRHSELSLNYSGGGTLSTNSALGSEYYHQLGVMQNFAWSRWRLQFFDQFSYLPDPQFGFVGEANLGVPGITGFLGPPLPGLRGNYVPSQSIFSSIGTRYSNAFAIQVVYAVSPRGSITASGSYGILRFLEAGNISTDDEIASLGYDYALTRQDTIGLVYRFSGYHYSGNPQAIGDHAFNVAYGRKVTARLALQLFGGPHVTTFRMPVGGMTERVSGSGGGSLTYAIRRGLISLDYIHGISGGSGVLIGSTEDTLVTSLAHQLGRVWLGHLDFGFARNGSLETGVSQTAQDYNSWFAGGGLSRPLGRDASLSFGYRARILTNNLPVCVAGSCALNHTQEQIALNFQWHTRPFVLR
jgi:hypothetical protein